MQKSVYFAITLRIFLIKRLDNIEITLHAHNFTFINDTRKWLTATAPVRGRASFGSVGRSNI